VVVVSVALQGSLIGTGFRASTGLYFGTVLVKENIMFITKRLKNFGPDSYER
jgi:hypothetical protein